MRVDGMRVPHGKLCMANICTFIRINCGAQNSDSEGEKGEGIETFTYLIGNILN